jgi:hypothetical protein
LLWLRKVCIWLRKSYVGHRKILWGVWLHHSPMLALVHHRGNSAAPEFLKMVAHNFLAHLLLRPWKNLLL